MADAVITPTREGDPSPFAPDRKCWFDAGQVIRCPGCGESMPMPLGSVKFVVAVGRAFCAAHKQCPEKSVGPGFVPHYDSKRGVPTTVCVGYRPMFFRIWREINGEESLKANPWVWAVSFKRIMRGCV